MLPTMLSYCSLTIYLQSSEPIMMMCANTVCLESLMMGGSLRPEWERACWKLTGVFERQRQLQEQIPEHLQEQLLIE